MSEEKAPTSKKLKSGPAPTTTSTPSTLTPLTTPKVVVNWGVIGCGKISRKWIRAILLSGHSVVAVASRSLTQAETFLTNNNLNAATTQVYDDYMKLIEDKNVQAVLITIPTTLRMEWVKKSLEHNKHVLMEKPHASAQQVGEMLQLASKRGVQLMDGVMFMHAARLKEMELRIFEDNGLGGPPTRVISMFADGVLPAENIRLNSSLEPMGSLADLGTYNVRITLWAFRWELPDRVRAVATSKAGDALTGVVAWMLYDDGRVGSFDANNASALSQWAHISSSSSVMKIPNFVVPSEQGSGYSIEHTKWGDFGCETGIEHVIIRPHVQECDAITVFSESISNQAPTNVFWGVCALKTQLVLDALMESIAQGGVEVSVNKQLAHIVLEG